MGFMTELGILNDQWSTIRKNPKRFVEEVERLMNGETLYAEDADGKRVYTGRLISGTTTGQAKVYQSHHADEPRLYLAWRNRFASLEQYDVEVEFGRRLDDPNDHIYKVLFDEIEVAEGMLKRLKKHLKERQEGV